MNIEQCIMGQECYKWQGKSIYNTILESITSYGCEVWQKKIMVFGNGFLAQISKNI
jgi:hypothetical protein